MPRKAPFLSPTAGAACALIVFAVAIRLALVMRGWPGPADSDEATMGLMARHIAYGGEHPLIYYGQNIIGPLEAYAGAAIFQILGPSVVSLRLGLVLLFVPFLATMYLLARLLYSPGLSLAVVLLLALGSPEMLGAQLFAGGHAETPLYCAALMLLSSWLALSTARFGPGRQRRHAGACGAWGVLAGFAVWGDPLVTPFVVAGAVILLWAMWRGCGRSLLLLALLGFLAGSAALLYMQAREVPGTLSGVAASPAGVSLYWHGHAYTLFSPTAVAGTLSESLPLALGANAICPQAPQIDYAYQPAQSLTIHSSWPGRQPLAWPPAPCTVVHTSWGLLCLLLGALAFVVARCRYRRLAPGGAGLPRAAEAAARDFARMALLGGAGLTLLIFMLSPAPATEPWTTRRYLVGLLAATPAVLWPLWQQALLLKALRREGHAGFAVAAGAPVTVGLLVWLLTARLSPAAGYVAGLLSSAPALLWTRHWERPVPACALLSRSALAACAAGLLLGAATALAAGVEQTFAAVPAAQRSLAQQADLIAGLSALGASRIYSDYWTCHRLAFASDERIICATLSAELAPDFDRYPPYRAIVSAAPNPWYVFPAGSPQDQAMAACVRTASPGWQESARSGYNIYRRLPSS